MSTELRGQQIRNLAGDFKPSEKYEFVNWDDDIPNRWENKTCSKPPTRYVFFFFLQMIQTSEAHSEWTPRSLAFTMEPDCINPHISRSTNQTPNDMLLPIMYPRDIPNLFHPVALYLTKGSIYKPMETFLGQTSIDSWF